MGIFDRFKKPKTNIPSSLANKSPDEFFNSLSDEDFLRFVDMFSKSSVDNLAVLFMELNWDSMDVRDAMQNRLEKMKK